MADKAYPLWNYTYDYISKPKFYKSFSRLIARMKAKYEREPHMITTVKAVLLVHIHNHLHVLLLKFVKNGYRLPGGRLKPGENEIEGLKRKLTNRLGRHPHYQPTWQIGECVAVWWRPNFDCNIYPYCPPHVTRPKECIKLFMVILPEREYFAIPINLDLVAAPLFWLYDNIEIFGRVISYIPEQISRFEIKKITSEETTEEP